MAIRPSLFNSFEERGPEMKKISVIIAIVLLSLGWAEIRTYRQVKDISTRGDGEVITSKQKSNMFEYTFDIDLKQKKITRIKVRRLDSDREYQDSTQYSVTGTKQILQSKYGGGGEAIVAVSSDGNEIIQLADRVAFTSRSSSFSQMVTGVYKRVR